MHKLLITLLAGAWLSMPAQAVDLMQVYKEALTNDAQYASARASLSAGEEKTPQGRAGLLPVIAASGSYSKIESSSDTDYNKTPMA